MSITVEQIKAGLELRSKLEAQGFSVVIAGGFARDVYFNEPPKDLDIVVAVRGLDDPMEVVKSALEAIGQTFAMFHMYNESNMDRIVGGFKCAGNIDIVLYDIKYAHDAVTHFDFNLNQFVLMNPETYEGAYVVYDGETSWHELEAVREDFSVDRRNLMREKFLNLTWRFPEGEGPARVPLSSLVTGI